MSTVADNHNNGSATSNGTMVVTHVPPTTGVNPLANAPPQLAAVIRSMSKEKMMMMGNRYSDLVKAGHNEQSSPELSKIAQVIKLWKNVQSWKQSMSQGKDSAIQVGSAVSANGLSTTGLSNGSSDNKDGTAHVFSDEQVATLKSQILAFRMLRTGRIVPPQLLQALLQEGDSSGAGDSGLPSSNVVARVAEAAAEVHFDAQKESPPVTLPPRPRSPINDPSDLLHPYNTFKHPLTALTERVESDSNLIATKQQRLLIPSLLPAGIDPHALLAERDRFVQARIQQRIRELEGFPSTLFEQPAHATVGSTIPSPGFQSENAKVKALIELKSLHLLERQKALREQVVRSIDHAASLALDRTAFRRFKKQTLRDARATEQLERKQRAEREKRAKSKHTDYLSTIIEHGKNLITAHKSSTFQALKLGRAVIKLHADTKAEEEKRVQRVAKERLNALKADDEEAYLKLLDTAKDTRITHLIRQTDAYLEGLAQAVQAQQNDDVHAEAIAAERAGIAPPSAAELAEQNANQEVGVAVDETMFGATRQDDPAEDKGKVDYYSVAHRITEHVTQQATILVGGKLKEYQVKGLQWMVSLFNNRLNGILADEMGLGKTIQTISLITFLIESKKQQGPYLVIVPLSTLTNWVNEFNKWAPSVSLLIYKGTPGVRKNLSGRLRAGNFQVLLTTYEYIIKDKNLLGKIKWVHMIIDEGHRMKNVNSKLTITLTSFYTSRYRLLLTGTPLQNNLPELWALLNFVLPKIFNSVKSFDEWFNTPFANAGADSTMQLTEEETLLIIKRLHKVLRPFLLRRLKKDVESELPDKVEKVIKCQMSALQIKLYSGMKKHKMILAGGDSDMIGSKKKSLGVRGLNNAIMQLRKICNHPYVFQQVEAAINPTKDTGPDLYRVAGKFELLDRLLPKLFATKHRVLMFFQMTAIMDIMEDFLRYRGLKYLRLDGSTKPDDRTELLTLFNAPDSEYFVFILSTRAGGLGLNLQTADTVIIYDSDWNPHQDLQAQDRAHRIGQKMEVRILRLVTEKSVEEMILAKAHDKLAMDGKVIQAGKFDNQATANEREALLRALLEADNDEEDDEEAAELTDEELNQILARGEHEIEIFRQIDIKREADEQDQWKAEGNKGPKPPRLLTEDELPDLYKQDFDALLLEQAAEAEGDAVRKREKVHYSDGLTDDQFLRALEDDDVDMNELVERKREGAVKRKAKQAALDAGTPDSLRRGRKDTDTATPEASPGPSGRKRKRVGESPAATPDAEATQSRSGAAPIRRRLGGVDDDTREAISAVLTRCYNAVEGAVDETGRKRSTLFVEVPKKAEYPDYHIIIQQPMALRQIKRKLQGKTYKSVGEGRDHFHLIFSNAKTYNQEGSWVWNDAAELQRIFDEQYEKHCRMSGLPGADNAEASEEAEMVPSSGAAASSAGAAPPRKIRVVAKKGRPSKTANDEDMGSDEE